MKKLLLSLTVMLSCLFIQAQSPIKNNGFESWNTISYMDPSYYHTSNDDAIRGGQLSLPNVNRVKDPEDSSFAIALSTVFNGHDTIGAFIANGDPGKVQGGIPYTQRASALTGYYKGKIMPGDTALVLVAFKKNGSPISFDVYKIHGQATSYTRFTLAINLPPVIIPDSVLLAFTSSNELSGRDIPGSYVQFDSIAFTGVTSQPMFLNGDFEQWSPSSIDILNDWYSSSNSVQKTTDSHTGLYAVQLQTLSNNGNTYGSNVSNAYWVKTGQNSGHYVGQPYTLTKDTLVGWYKYTPNGVDSASASISLTLNGNPVGGVFAPLPPVSTYTYFEIPFNAAMNPDSIIVSLNSSNANTDPSNSGSVFTVDDIYLKSQIVKVSGIVSNVSCNGAEDGSVSTTATGGVLPYSFEWSDGVLGSMDQYMDPGTYTLTVTDNVGMTSTSSFTITEPTAITMSFVEADATCGMNDGSLTVNASGGAGSYSYLWGDASTTMMDGSLAAGSYYVTVTDGTGCMSYSSGIVNNVNGPSLSFTVTNLTCNYSGDGIAVVTATGGTGTYMYNWNNGSVTNEADNLIADIPYSVSVTDGAGCLTISSVMVTQPSEIQIPVTVMNNVSCNGGNDGSAMATPNGGTGSYTYGWSTGDMTATASGLIADLYTVSVTDANGCSNYTYVMITEPSAVGITISSNDLNCNGDNSGYILASGNGGTGAFTYSWNTTATTSYLAGISAGIYTVTVTDANNCSANTSVMINEPTVLQVSVTTVGTDATANVTGGTPNYAYSWNTGGVGMTENGLTIGTTYTVVVTDANGCSAMTTVDIITTSIKGTVQNLGMTVYPNPATEQLNVSGDLSSGTVLIVRNVIGEVVRAIQIAQVESTYKVDVSDLTNGIYTIEIEQGGKRYVNKFSKIN